MSVIQAAGLFPSRVPAQRLADNDLAGKVGQIVCIAASTAKKGVMDCPACGGRLFWSKDRHGDRYHVSASCNDKRCGYGFTL